MRAGTLLLIAAFAAVASPGDDERPSFAGFWSGTKKSEPQGSCKTRGDGFGAASLDIKIDAEGKVTAKDSQGRRFEGTIGSDLAVKLVLKSRSSCPINGRPESREWTATYAGEVTNNEGVWRMSLQGTESPCDDCGFKVQYSLRKN